MLNSTSTVTLLLVNTLFSKHFMRELSKRRKKSKKSIKWTPKMMMKKKVRSKKKRKLKRMLESLDCLRKSLKLMKSKNFVMIDWSSWLIKIKLQTISTCLRWIGQELIKKKKKLMLIFWKLKRVLLTSKKRKWLN
jgi:hypothetical protein